jgi:AraC-like DNA-binding protein
MSNQLKSMPLLIGWGVRAMYIGPGFQLQAHRNSVAVLALALKKPMRVALQANDRTKGFRTCNSVLIEPNQLHLLETSVDDFAFIYLDALSYDLATLRTRFEQRGDQFSFDFDNEQKIVDLLNKMPRDLQSWNQIESLLYILLGFDQRKKDSRIALVVQALIISPDDDRQAQNWADQIGLSSSRFQHLFKEIVGVSFRRFRLWARMRMALKLTLSGASLTDSAMAAGLSSSAHLGAAFKDMFGITPSQLVSAKPQYFETNTSNVN